MLYPRKIGSKRLLKKIIKYVKIDTNRSEGKNRTQSHLQERNSKVTGIGGKAAVLFCVAGLLLYSSLTTQVWAALTQTSKTVTAQEEFSKGNLVDTVVTSTDDGEVRLDGDGGPGWFDSDWKKRKSVTIINSGSAQTDYQINLTVPYDSDMQSDFDDLRFANSDGDLLDYWLQSKTDGVQATVWVEADNVAGSGNTTIYMYYSNTSVSSGSNGEATFLLFDDFDDGVINPIKWTEVDQVPPGEIYESGGKLIFERYSNDNWDKTVYGNTTYARSDLSFEMDYQWTSNNSSYDALMMGWHDNTTGTSYTNLIYGYYNAGDGGGSTVAMRVYEDGSSRSGVSGNWTQNTDYDVRIRMRQSGGAYYEYSSDSGQNWNTAYATTYSTESNVRPGWAFYCGRHEYDNARIRKWMSSEPTTSFGSEESALAPLGTYTSPCSTESNSGIIDLDWNGGWSNNGNGNAFEATVDIPSNTSIDFRIRSSSTGGSQDSDWSSWVDLGEATSSGTFGVSASGLSAVPQGENKYVQVKATLTSSDGLSSPVLRDYSICYLADEEDPTNPTSCLGFEDSSKTTSITSGDWYNHSSPCFEFAGAEDVESGIDGYYVYFGTDPTAIPQTAGTYQASDEYEANLGSSQSGQTLYLRIQARDKAGNIYTAADTANYTLFTYRYDATPPQNPVYVSANPAGYSATDLFSFSWPEGSDSHSGVSGYEYKRATDPSWTFTTSRNVSGITSYQNGENVFYVRTVDIAGNRGQAQAQTPYYFNNDAPSAPQSVQTNPGTNTTNSFSFSWEEPQNYTGEIVGYYYSINVPPTEETASYTAEDNLSAFAAATQAGQNTFYVVAKDDAGNVGWASPGSVSFWCNTVAPGIPLNVTITDSSNREISDWRLTVNWQAPTYTGSDFAGYKVYRSSDGINFGLIATTTSTGYLDSGLNNSCTYLYKVTAYDNSNNEGGFSSLASKQPTGRFISPPNLVGGPSLTASSTKAVATWTTDRESDSFVEYGKTTAYGSTQGQIESTKEHQVALAGLESSTTYHFRARWRDSDGNVGYSSDGTFTTDEAAYIASVKITDIGLNSATVNWSSTTVSTSKVRYGKTTAYENVIEDSSGSSVTKHTLKLDGLDHSSVYHYKIESIDTDGNVLYSEDHTFETLKYPSISNVLLQPIKGELAASMKVTWDSNVPTTSIVEYAPVADKANLKEEGKSKLEAKHSVVLSDLQDDTEYVLVVKGRDQFGNMVESDTQTFKTDYDTRPPKVSNITTETSIVGSGEEARGQVVVSWNTDEAATSQVEYGIGVSGKSYSNKTQQEENYTTSHVVVISNLRPSTSYHFRVVSKDKSKNIAESADNSVLTEQAKRPVLDLVIESLKARLGWIFKMFGA